MNRCKSLVFLTIEFGLSLFVIQSNNIFFIKSFKEAREELENADKDTWVLFDIDQTLLISKDQNFWPKNYALYAERISAIEQELYASITPEQCKILKSKRYLNQEQQVIEKEIVHSIQLLQERGVKVLGLTARVTGSYGVIQSFPTLTSSQLKINGIDFNKFRISHVILDQLPAYEGSYPIFFEGTISTNRMCKADVLNAFIDLVQDEPSRILFFDDIFENVAQVANAMTLRGIQFKGYVYQGANLLECSFNENILKLKHQHLIEHGHWLTDEEAEELFFHTRLLESVRAKLSIE